MLVHLDEVIGRGGNKTNVTRNGSRHCEIEAFEQVMRRESDAVKTSGKNEAHKHAPVSWPEVELYVTCEPCIMCAGAISLMGIKRVFYGCSNDKFGGCGSVYSFPESGE